MLAVVVERLTMAGLQAQAVAVVVEMLAHLLLQVRLLELLERLIQAVEAEVAAALLVYMVVAAQAALES
jgi:hypothetical protein